VRHARCARLHPGLRVNRAVGAHPDRLSALVLAIGRRPLQTLATYVCAPHPSGNPTTPSGLRQGHL
jgi:hypothetical protein